MPAAGLVQELGTFSQLLLGTILYRPYVYLFFACFLVFAMRHLRARGTFIYLVLAYAIAFFCEYSATRNGFPFGKYVYLDSTRSRELWISNIPFWDSLSFVFLSYFSWLFACLLLSPDSPSLVALKTRTACLSGVLMMWLDVVIDPLTLKGDKWFLGRIYYYPHGGSYFGVTLTNFAGWFFVGTITILAFQALCRRRWVDVSRWRQLSYLQCALGFGVYAGVLIFQLSVTAWIKEWRLLVASLVVSFLAVLPGVLVVRGARA